MSHPALSAEARARSAGQGAPFYRSAPTLPPMRNTEKNEPLGGVRPKSRVMHAGSCRARQRRNLAQRVRLVRNSYVPDAPCRGHTASQSVWLYRHIDPTVRRQTRRAPAPCRKRNSRKMSRARRLKVRAGHVAKIERTQRGIASRHALYGYSAHKSSWLYRNMASAVQRQTRRPRLPITIKHPPPLPVRLTPSHRLDLAPVVAFAGAVGRGPPLRYDALELHALGRLEQLRAIVEGFNQVQARISDRLIRRARRLRRSISGSGLRSWPSRCRRSKAKNTSSWWRDEAIGAVQPAKVWRAGLVWAARARRRVWPIGTRSATNASAKAARRSVHSAPAPA